MKKDKLVLRLFLTFVVIMSLALSIDWGDVWCRIWDVAVSILLCMWIWTVDIYFKKDEEHEN